MEIRYLKLFDYVYCLYSFSFCQSLDFGFFFKGHLSLSKASTILKSEVLK
jgi:hypothetical protein